MADNEKLDNQRLKNFKNKGRDLEVKVARIGTAAAFAASFAPGFLVTSFLISTGTLHSNPRSGPSRGANMRLLAPPGWVNCLWAPLVAIRRDETCTQS